MNLLLLLPRWVRQLLNTPVIELELPQTQTKKNSVREIEIKVVPTLQLALMKLTKFLTINLLNTVSAMQNTVAAKSVRFIRVKREVANADGTEIVTDIKAVVTIDGNAIDYVTTSGEEKKLTELSFFANNLFRIIREKGGNAYLDVLQNKATESGISLDTIYSKLLCQFKYLINIEDGKIDLEDIELGEKVEKAIAKYNKTVDDILF